MNRVIDFFDYEHCYESYLEKIDSVHSHKRFGETILAKPVFLLAIIDGMDFDIFVNNQFLINDWLEEHYNQLMSKYSVGSQFDKTAGIEKPYWHLESDGFWHLNYPGGRLNKTKTQSKSWLKSNVSQAYLDESLWILLQNKFWRTRLRDYIIEHKLSDGNWAGKLAAEGLGLLATILLVA